MKTFGTLALDAGEWVVDAAPHVALRFKRVFPQVRQSGSGAIRMANTDANARELAWFMDRFPLRMPSRTRAALDEAAARHVDREAIVDKLLRGRRAPRAFEMALPPREYQRVAAEMCLTSGGLLCADDVGLGKTAVGICVLSEPTARPALVVTLTHLPKQWEAEIHRFAPGLTTHVLKKGTPYDLTVAAPPGAQLSLDEPSLPDVIITSYSKLAGWADTLAPVVRSVIYDEVQELRRDGTRKYEAASVLSHMVTYRLGLSATPIYNHGSEIYQVMDVIQPGALGTRYEFTREWCGAMDARGRALVRDPKALSGYLRDEGLMLRRTRADVGRELPSLQKVPHHVECDARALADAEDAASALAHIILGSESSFEERGRAARELDWKLRQATGIAKAVYVAEFVRMLVESGEKVVLYGWHRDVYAIWLERLKDLEPALYTGSESAPQKARAKERFVSGETDVLVMSLRSGAGLDGLQHHARTVVFGELDWSPGVHDQCVGRIHRDGQPEPVVAYYLIADEGSDPVVADVLGVKRAQAKGLLDPDAPLVEALGHDGQHAKRLAAAYLKRDEREERREALCG